jgi:hypothetical protein
MLINWSISTQVYSCFICLILPLPRVSNKYIYNKPINILLLILLKGGRAVTFEKYWASSLAASQRATVVESTGLAIHSTHTIDRNGCRRGCYCLVRNAEQKKKKKIDIGFILYFRNGTRRACLEIIFRFLNDIRNVLFKL